MGEVAREHDLERDLCEDGEDCGDEVGVDVYCLVVKEGPGVEAVV